MSQHILGIHICFHGEGNYSVKGNVLGERDIHTTLFVFSVTQLTEGEERVVLEMLKSKSSLCINNLMPLCKSCTSQSFSFLFRKKESI